MCNFDNNKLMLYESRFLNLNYTLTVACVRPIIFQGNGSTHYISG